MNLCKSQHYFSDSLFHNASKSISILEISKNINENTQQIRLCSGPTQFFVVKYCMNSYLYTKKMCTDWQLVFLQSQS